MRPDPRRLSDLISVGPAMLRDFEILGVRTVSQLARRNPERLYESLCRVAPAAPGHLLFGRLSRSRSPG